MIPYARQHVSNDDIDAVIKVLCSDFLTQGPVLPQFEQAVADYCVGTYGVAVNSATSALHIACLALDLGPGDWLWTSPNTFVASANCALYCGAKIDFVDIDPDTYNMGVDALTTKLEKAEKNGRLPKIVMPVHFAGQPCDMPAINALSQRYGFKIIEDASHAMGASYASEDFSDIATATDREAGPWQSNDAIKVGSCTHSDITVFSFHPVKIITSGEGGMALTNSDELANRLRRLRIHGITSDKGKMWSRPEDEIWNYQQIELGFNYRMTEIQAALGLSQLNRLDEYVAQRHEIAKDYDTDLATLPITIPWQSPNAYSSYHLYPVRVIESESKKTQRELYEGLRARGIAVNVHYIPVHRQPYYESLGFAQGDYPEAERLHREVISLPMYPSLTKVQQQSVTKVLRESLVSS